MRHPVGKVANVVVFAAGAVLKKPLLQTLAFSMLVGGTTGEAQQEAQAQVTTPREAAGAAAVSRASVNTNSGGVRSAPSSAQTQARAQPLLMNSVGGMQQRSVVVGQRK